MQKNLVIGIVVVLALIVAAWFFAGSLLPQPVTTPLAQPEAPTDMSAGSESDVAASLAGTWRSTTDANFVRTFSADGRIVDTYAGAPDATTEGQWSFVTNPTAESLPVPVDPNTRIIKATLEEEVLYFSVVALTENRLELTYLGGAGGILSFERVN